MTEATQQEEDAAGRRAYKPSRALFFVMLAVIVGALAAFIVMGPLKGGGVGGGSGTGKSTSAPSGQH